MNGTFFDYLRSMYHLNHFKALHEGEVFAFMKAHPFITLCGVDQNNQPVATHIPVLIEERDDTLFLQAHVMRKQAHTTAFEFNNEVLAIFQGAHSYISASWYEEKKVASTWNYQAVHVRGKLRFLDEQGLYNLLVKLTAHFENNPDSPAQVKQMDEAYIKANMKPIVAFEIEVTDIQHVFKLSQNRNKQSFENIANQLNKGDSDARIVAEEMLKRKDQIFKL